VDANDMPPVRLGHRTRLGAGLALLPAVMAAAWLCSKAPFLFPVYVACVVLIAVPLLAETRRAFVKLCLTIAGLFVPLSIPGVFFGLLFLPSAVVLLATAGLAARRSRTKIAANDMPPDRLGRRTRLEAGLALLPAVMAAAWLWINAPIPFPDYLACVMLIAVPLLAETTRAF
jgi:hypothetical protein